MNPQPHARTSLVAGSTLSPEAFATISKSCERPIRKCTQTLKDQLSTQFPQTLNDQFGVLNFHKPRTTNSEYSILTNPERPARSTPFRQTLNAQFEVVNAHKFWTTNWEYPIYKNPERQMLSTPIPETLNDQFGVLKFQKPWTTNSEYSISQTVNDQFGVPNLQKLWTTNSQYSTVTNPGRPIRSTHISGKGLFAATQAFRSPPFGVWFGVRLFSDTFPPQMEFCAGHFWTPTLRHSPFSVNHFMKRHPFNMVANTKLSLIQMNHFKQ